MSRRRAAIAAVALGAAALASAGCAGLTGSVPAAADGRVTVVAAEAVWGSIAAQIAGRRAEVTSIIANPAQDPHAYEPTTADARAVATAQLVIVNGLGYDPWAPKLLAADGSAGGHILTVGQRLGLPVGSNPHRWYDPGDVVRVAAAIARVLERIDPAHRRAYTAGLRRFDTMALARYHALIDVIRRRYSGVPIGASESIVAPLARALGLRLLTPASLLRAVSEGGEITAQDTATAERQIAARRIRVWVENRQNLTPEIERLDGLARAAAIPVVAVTETPTPAGTSFERWQDDQLERLASALHEATGR